VILEFRFNPNSESAILRYVLCANTMFEIVETVKFSQFNKILFRV